MAIYNENEDIIYCGECGVPNKRSVHICENCSKEIKTRHYPYKDFLNNHLKSEIRDRAADSVFNLVRKFVFSHFYGTVLTISVVAAVTVSAVTVSS
jgi:hypothetical protein